MSFRRRLSRVAALGFAVAAVGAPASYALPQDPYSGEGYGGSMDAGSPVNQSSVTRARSIASGGFVPQNPYSGEGYGGSMDSGSPINSSLQVHALDPAIQGVYVADFWNYSGREKISNHSPGVAPSDLDRLTHAAPSSAVQRPSVTRSSSDGFSWGDAGTGAASVLGLVILASAAAMLVRRNREGRLARA
jgi:hypothetical protein